MGKVTILTRRKLESVGQEYGVDVGAEETAGRLQQQVEGLLISFNIAIPCTSVSESDLRHFFFTNYYEQEKQRQSYTSQPLQLATRSIA